jgi:hypothetical protein
MMNDTVNESSQIGYRRDSVGKRAALENHSKII